VPLLFEPDCPALRKWVRFFKLRVIVPSFFLLTCELREFPVLLLYDIIFEAVQ